jgi:sec-independent protein translocase protein TatB
MPSFWDSGFIVLLALMLFGPKKLPVLARQLGKLMADFRRASTEFRTQMEEELRISEQADRQKQIAAIEAAAPPAPALDAPADSEHPHIPPPEPTFATADDGVTQVGSEPFDPGPPPLPIATSGELSIMPPATGLPVSNGSLSPFVDSIPEAPAHETMPNGAASAPDLTHHSIASNGATPEPAHESAHESEARPWMI